jgi:PiT family inorganic phosphate transporter
LFAPAEKDKAPPFWIRGLLVLTCTGVSYAHGSNDGQKGMGLIMLILIGIVPSAFALKMDTDAAVLSHLVAESSQVTAVLQRQVETATPQPAAAADQVSAFLSAAGKKNAQTVGAILTLNQAIAAKITGLHSYSELPKVERKNLRIQFYLVSEGLAKLDKNRQIAMSAAEKSSLAAYRSDLEKSTKYIPTWVKVAVALSLGLGTMIGWKRIVVTVGEKIGKTHLTYAQGASAELVAMGTILAADNFGLPVSTTHVLSSGVAGTMAANHSGLQTKTLRNLLLAWVLTLPVCIFLGAVLFASGLYLVFNVFGLK